MISGADLRVKMLVVYVILDHHENLLHQAFGAFGQSLHKVMLLLEDQKLQAVELAL